MGGCAVGVRDVRLDPYRLVAGGSQVRRPGVIVTSMSGNTPRTTIDLRLYIGNDTRANIIEAIDAAVIDFKEQVEAKLTEELKL